MIEPRQGYARGKNGTRMSSIAETPEHLVKVAERAAVVTPSERGYFGGSAVQRYQWMPTWSAPIGPPRYSCPPEKYR